MKWIKLFETFVYEDITITPKNTPRLNIVKKPKEEISIVKKPRQEISITPKNTPELNNVNEPEKKPDFYTFNSQINKKEDIKKYVAWPLLKACEIFWDKNIKTTGSWVVEIQKENDKTFTNYIHIDYNSLSEKNKEIAQNIIKEGNGSNGIYHGGSKEDPYIELIISKVGELTMREIETKSIDISNRFVSQDLLWYQPTTLDSQIKGLKLRKSRSSEPQEYDREIERIKKDWSSGKEMKGHYFDSQTQTYWDSKELYDKRPKHLY